MNQLSGLVLYSNRHGYVLQNQGPSFAVGFGKCLWNLPLAGLEAFCEYLAHLLTSQGQQSNQLGQADRIIVAMEQDSLSAILSRAEIGQLLDLLDQAILKLRGRQLTLQLDELD